MGKAVNETKIDLIRAADNPVGTLETRMNAKLAEATNLHEKLTGDTLKIHD